MGQEDDYLKWKGTPAVGCAFARFLARRPNGLGQRLEVVDDTTPVDIAAKVDAVVLQLIADSKVVAATLAIPALTDLEVLVEVALNLGNKPGWTVTRRPIADTPRGPMVAFGLLHEVSLATGATVPSEALVLGPFEEFPATRRAPVTALEIFVGNPPVQTRYGDPTLKANLDLIPVDPPIPQVAFNNMWETTKELRSTSLGGIDDPCAKAKVSFVITAALAKRLGCER